MSSTQAGRRRFLAAVAAGTGAFMSGCRGTSAVHAQAPTRTTSLATLAARRETLIRNAYLLTMDDTIRDVAGGDVHIRDGVIAAVGRGLRAPGADEIDGRGMIVMPGFVDTHWHMWNGVFRGMTQTPAEYFALQRLAPYFTPADHYSSIAFAAAEAITAGFTTVHDWSHGLQSAAAAESEMQALVDSGIRARFGCGNLQQTAAGGKDLPRFIAWAQTRGDSRLTIGVVTQNADTFREEVAAARAAGARTIGTHVNPQQNADVIGPDFILTHGGNYGSYGPPDTPAALGFTPAFINVMKERRAKMALCPSSDLLMGMGFIPTTELLDAGFPADDIGFSVDVTCQTNANPFELMRIVLGTARNKARDARRLSPRQVLRIGTIGGAHVLGLEQETGSLTPGKRADLIMLRTSDINMIPAGRINPTYLVVLGAQPANVDTVIVDGRVLKRGGRLLHIDAAAVARDAAAVQARIRAA
ncbi:MAG: amidohydrolase family protein, partial [Vicinamibacterales bacterium]